MPRQSRVHVCFTRVSSFLTSLKEGEKLIEEDRMHGLAKWNQIVSDAISSTTLTSLIGKAAADKARPPVRVVLISGGYYAGVAAKLVDKKQLTYSYAPALECHAKLIALRDNADADAKDIANVARLITILDNLFGSHLEHVEYLFARDWHFQGVNFRTTWTAGWYLEAMVRSKFQDKASEDAPTETLVDPLNAIALEVEENQVRLFAIFILPHVRLIELAHISKNIKEMAAKMSCEDEQLDKNAAQLRYVCHQLEKGLDKLIAKVPDVPLNSFEHGCIRVTTWYGRLSPEDRPEVDEMMKRLSDSLKNKCISLKMMKMKKCNLVMEEMAAEQRAVFQRMAVQFAMKKNGLVDCDGVLASDSDAVYLSSMHAKGAAIIDAGLLKGVEIYESKGCTAWRALVQASWDQCDDVHGVKAALVAQIATNEKPKRLVLLGDFYDAARAAGAFEPSADHKPAYMDATTLQQKLAIFMEGNPSYKDGANAIRLQLLLQLVSNAPSLENVKCVIARERDWKVDGHTFDANWATGWALSLKRTGASEKAVLDHAPRPQGAEEDDEVEQLREDEVDEDEEADFEDVLGFDDVLGVEDDEDESKAPKGHLDNQLKQKKQATIESIGESLLGRRPRLPPLPPVHAMLLGSSAHSRARRNELTAVPARVASVRRRLPHGEHTGDREGHDADWRRRG